MLSRRVQGLLGALGQITASPFHEFQTPPDRDLTLFVLSLPILRILVLHVNIQSYVSR